MSGRQTNIDQLAAVSVRLGEAAVDPSRWRHLLEEMCRALGATGASLRQKGIRTADVPYTESMEDLTKQYFREGWHLRDTRLKKLLSLSMRRPTFHDFDVFEDEELKGLMRRDPFFNDFLGAGKLAWSAWIQFRVGNDPWMIGFQRTVNQGAFGPDDTLALQLLSSALTETANLSAAVGYAVLTGMMNALDLVVQPAIAVNCSGVVLATNASAEATFDDAVRVHNGRLFVADGIAQQQFQNLFARMNSSWQVPSKSSELIPIKRKLNSTLLCRILPIPAAARSPFLGAGALLVFSDRRLSRLPGSTSLVSMFNFTPAEVRLATHLASGESVSDAANQLSLSVETIRSQLKSMFSKTGTHRQSELLNLLSRL